MKKTITTIFLSTLIISLLAQTWTSVSTGFPDADFDCIQMIDGSTAYAAGYNNIASNTLIIKTIDGGESWTDVSPFNDAGYVVSIAFSDANNGFLTLSSGKIYLTTNGGTDWTQTLTDEEGSVFVVKYAGNNAFYALHSAGKMYKTVNMGTDWTLAYNYGSNIFLNTILSSGKAMDFSSENYCMFGYGGEPGELYLYDGEEIYSTYSSSHNASFDAVCAINDDLFYASSGARFVRISNPGSDFQISNNLTNALYINSLDFLDSNHGFGTTSSGKIYSLTNLGASYTTEIEDLPDIRDISIGDNFTVMACGHGAAIYKREGSVNSSVYQHDANSNISVYPVPAKNEITLVLNENIVHEVAYQIINTLGQCVKEGNISGITTTINVSELFDGIYYLEFNKNYQRFIICK
jgi:photosystem II stability/assembly factor-like uncharacterized protein